MDSDKLNETMKQRAEDYGPFKIQAGTIAEMWTAYLKRRPFYYRGDEYGVITAEDVANMMILFKMGRAANAKNFKADTYLDIQGYAELQLESHAETGGETS